MTDFSLYARAIGVSPEADKVLALLGTTRGAVPRFRDAYMTKGGQIAIYTRLGGTAKAEGAAADAKGDWSAFFYALPGLVSDTLDEQGSDYRTFTYAVPGEKATDAAKIPQAAVAPVDAWALVVADIKAGAANIDPVLLDALEVQLADKLEVEVQK